MMYFTLFFSLILGACATWPLETAVVENPQSNPEMVESQRAEHHRAVASEELYVANELTGRMLFPSGIDGPAMDREGNLYVANFQSKGTIGRKAMYGDFVLWQTLPAVLDPSNSASLPRQGVAASLRFDARNILYVADYVNHRVLKVNPRTTDPVEIHFSAEQAGVKMNQPNDIAIARDGTLYLSDPGWNSRDEKRGSIWRINPHGAAEQIVKDLYNPNGIELSPDETKLYFTESATSKWVGPPEAKEFIYVLDLNSGKDPPQLFAEYPGLNLDGLRSDSAGNIFVAVITGGRVDQWSPAGQRLREIKLNGEKPKNIGFGGPDGCTAYVTQGDGGYVESFRVDNPGRDWLLLHGK